MKYKTEDEIFNVVRGFENGTILRADWRHAEHLTVALYYVLHTQTLSDACDRMRTGIFSLLKSFEIDLSKEMPYHVTLTEFWMRTVSSFADSKNKHSIVELTNELVEIYGDKDLPLRFYSRELLFSERARAKFVVPDLEEC